ncbi:hypothetical protein [Streptomyces sp. NPDC007088]|uniref:hypothetical protein n=1 Tax=Streptomyces sp. NPDC007088 TaxID=3364773 RepID=UPI00368AAFF6
MNGAKRALGGALVLATAGACLLGGAGSAAARTHGPTAGSQAEADQHGNSGGGHISSTVHITYTQRGGALGGSGGRAAVADWDPPGCWYAPEYDPEQFEESRQRLYFAAVHDPGANDIVRDISSENQGYAKDEYHKKDKGKGMYWTAQYRDDATIEQMMECDRPPFWAENGTAPDVPHAISPEILAGLAYERMKVPSLKAKLAPAAASKVNLPTWVWLDKADVEPVSVTASLDVGGFHMEATTTATPTGMKVEPGTEDAHVIPGGGNCPVADGAIGEPFAAGKADRTPPCGVTYTRSSGQGTYRMSAAVNWETRWTGTGGAGGDLPDGTYGQTRDVRVEEIQAVNR